MTTKEHDFSILEKKKIEIQKELEKRTNVKFNKQNSDNTEEEFKNTTIGLVTK